MPSTLGNPYVTAAQLKTYLSISDNEDDALIEQAVKTASRSIESYCRRQFNHDAGTPTARVFAAQDAQTVNMALNGSEIYDPTSISVAVDPSMQGIYSIPWTTPLDYVTLPFDGIRAECLAGRPAQSRRLASGGFPAGMPGPVSRSPRSGAGLPCPRKSSRPPT